MRQIERSCCAWCQGFVEHPELATGWHQNERHTRFSPPAALRGVKAKYAAEGAFKGTGAAFPSVLGSWSVPIALVGAGRFPGSVAGFENHSGRICGM